MRARSASTASSSAATARSKRRARAGATRRGRVRRGCLRFALRVALRSVVRLRVRSGVRSGFAATGVDRAVWPASGGFGGQGHLCARATGCLGVGRRRRGRLLSSSLAWLSRVLDALRLQYSGAPCYPPVPGLAGGGLPVAALREGVDLRACSGGRGWHVRVARRGAVRPRRRLSLSVGSSGPSNAAVAGRPGDVARQGPPASNACMVSIDQPQSVGACRTASAGCRRRELWARGGLGWAGWRVGGAAARCVSVPGVALRARPSRAGAWGTRRGGAWLRLPICAWSSYRRGSEESAGRAATPPAGRRSESLRRGDEASCTRPGLRPRGALSWRRLTRGRWGCRGGRVGR